MFDALLCGKDTTKVIGGSLNVEDVMLKKSLNAGFALEQIEILTQDQFDEHLAIETQPITESSDKERIAELENVINGLLLGGSI